MEFPPLRRIFHASLVGIVLAVSTGVVAQQPLHEKIDELIQQDQFFGVGPTASDSEFMRRVYLDLIGTTPGPQEVRELCCCARPGDVSSRPFAICGKRN